MGKSKWKIDEYGRQCTKCGEYKLWEEFGKSKRGVQGYKCQCKSCRNQKSAKKRRDIGIKISTKWKIDEHGRECACCKKYKSWDNFTKSKSRRTGYSSTCRVCNNKIQMRKRRNTGVQIRHVYKIDDKGRECTVCGVYKLYDEFSPSKKGMYGYQSKCRFCVNKMGIQQRRVEGIIARPKYYMDTNGRYCSKCKQYKVWKNFNKDNKDNKGINEYGSICKSCKAKRSAQYHKQNKEIIAKKGAKWRRENKEHIKERQKIRLQNDPEYKLTRKLRSRVRSAIKAQNTKKSGHTMKLIGCSPKFLINHFNTAASNGLKFGNKDIEVDHIIPCISFNLSDELEQYICFNWRNQQLLTAFDNRSKHDTPPDNVEELYNDIKEHVLKDNPHLIIN